MPRPLPTVDPAQIDRIREHYRLEVELAGRLRASCREERQRLYTEVYDELFRRIPWHGQHVRGPTHMARVNRALLGFLRPWLRPGDTVLEIGAGDGTFAEALAGRSRHAYALDVSAGVFDGRETPANFDFLVSDGVSIPLADGAVDLAFSNQLFEHLHPDDVQPHLREVRRVLRPGGRYVVLTPTRLSGPHDVSGYFDDEPRGFHLREYTCGELAAELRAAGFRRVQALLKLKRWLLRYPVGTTAALERVLESQPRDRQRRLASRAPLAQLVAARVVART